MWLPLTWLLWCLPVLGCSTPLVASNPLLGLVCVLVCKSLGTPSQVASSQLGTGSVGRHTVCVGIIVISVCLLVATFYMYIMSTYCFRIYITKCKVHLPLCVFSQEVRCRGQSTPGLQQSLHHQCCLSTSWSTTSTTVPTGVGAVSCSVLARDAWGYLHLTWGYLADD